MQEAYRKQPLSSHSCMHKFIHIRDVFDSYRAIKTIAFSCTIRVEYEEYDDDDDDDDRVKHRFQPVLFLLGHCRGGSSPLFSNTSRVRVEYGCERSSTSRVRVWYVEYESGTSQVGLRSFEYESGTSTVF